MRPTTFRWETSAPKLHSRHASELRDGELVWSGQWRKESLEEHLSPADECWRHLRELLDHLGAWSWRGEYLTGLKGATTHHLQLAYADGVALETRVLENGRQPRGFPLLLAAYQALLADDAGAIAALVADASGVEPTLPTPALS